MATFLKRFSDSCCCLRSSFKYLCLVIFHHTAAFGRTWSDFFSSSVSVSWVSFSSRVSFSSVLPSMESVWDELIRNSLLKENYHSITNLKRLKQTNKRSRFKFCRKLLYDEISTKQKYVKELRKQQQESQSLLKNISTWMKHGWGHRFPWGFFTRNNYCSTR